MDKKIEIANCSCGCSAELKTKSVVFGQGMFGDEYFVESACGMRGKKFDSYDLKALDAISKAIDFWNLHTKTFART